LRLVDISRLLPLSGTNLQKISHAEVDCTMASKVKITLTWGQDTAVLTLLDPVGPNNTWNCDPTYFLSQGSGKWSQGLGSRPVVLSDTTDKIIVLQFGSLNMFDPKVGQSGDDAISSGEGGTVGDQQVVKWIVNSVD
jgi:hypothetical protein